MKRASIKEAPNDEKGYFPTSLKHTGLNQRETLEETIKNLATCLGVKVIHKKLSARGSYFYKPEDAVSYQSASNTILELSRQLLDRQK